VPYESHVLQLAAYCLLVTAAYGRRPAYGLLQYPGQAFQLPYTKALENRLRVVLERMQDAGAEPPARSHDLAGRCRACAYRASCDQRLV
jgi:CRISPR-associated exonuclease Cas4